MSNKSKYDGIPAVPTCWIDEKGEVKIEHGMTLRDWYTGMAMQSLLDDSMAWNLSHSYHVAKVSFEIADAMINVGKNGSNKG